jgi:hypothetical protein
MGYKKAYNPKDYYDIGEILDQILELQSGYQFTVRLPGEEIDKMAFRIWQFLNQTQQKHLYTVKKETYGITICRSTKVTFEITEPVPIPVDTVRTE